ncbi:PREDICTED: melatonin receptor type 1C-like [Acropora digitifera]|uniref:melatonin receptor type 1C-like n=1 Tax=Acropora digitifera TaxID=70779 RepID=UPI00077AFDD1|nr:PREDICTED: melatonin receptor type 1C-like [Acropora digitifera]
MNTSLSSLEKFALQLKHRSTVVQLVESLFLFLINFASFFGNLLLGIAVVRNPTLRRTVPNMYIINLAVSDFLMSLVGIPLSLAALIVGEWPFNNFICQVQGFWILLMCAVSLQTLAVTAVNRYVRVVRSRSLYQKLFNFKTTKVTIGAVWFMALFAPLPYAFAGHKYIFHTAKVFCAHNPASLDDGYGAYLVLVFVAVPLIIILICYTKVLLTVRKHNLSFRSRNQVRGICSTSENSLSVEEVNVTYVLLVVVIGFLTCWTPVLVIDLIDFINADWKLKREVYVSYTCFGWASTSLNPIIYGIMNRSFRAEYLRILAPLKACRSNLPSRSSRSVRGLKRNGNRKHLDENKGGESFEKGVEKNAGNDASAHVKHRESSGQKINDIPL